MNIAPDYKDLCSVTDVAAKYHVDRKTVYNWLKCGTAPLGVTICGKHYFFKSALANFQPPTRGRKPRVSHLSN